MSPSNTGNERLQKVLARAGIASRRACEEIIAEGRVTVNGEMVTKPGTTVDAQEDEIRVDGSRIAKPHRVYWLVNKPRGVLCTSNDPEGRRQVIDMVPDERHRLFTVGRLDEDSEGLIIVTNDGDLAQLIAHPRHEVEKIYDLSIRGDISPQDVRKIESGIWLSEGRTGTARMKIKRRGPKVSHVLVTIREGRNREIRRMFARIDHPVIRLRRIQIGPIKDSRLKPGLCRRLTGSEVKELVAVASGKALPAKKKRPAAKSGAKRPASRKAPGKKPSGRKPSGGRAAARKPAGRKPKGSRRK